MLKHCGVSLATLLLLTSTVLSQPATSPSTRAQQTQDQLATAKSEILPLFKEMEAAANAHDTDRHLALYAHTPSLQFVINDQLIVGWNALREKQQQWWKNGKTDVVYQLSAPPDFMMLAPDAVVVTFFLTSHRTLPDGTPQDTRFGISSIWKKLPEGWRIIYAHESTVKQ